MLISVTQQIKFIESIFGTGRLGADGKNFGVRCPICSPNDVNKRKLIILLPGCKTHCWTCGWKSYTLVPLIHKFGTKSQLQKYRDEFMPDDVKASTWFRSNEEDTEKKDEEQKLTLPSDFKLLTMSNTSDPDIKATWLYLKSRGITKKDAWYFKLGVSNEPRWRGRIIVPSFDQHGVLNYFIGRSIYDRDRRQKYDNPDKDKLPIIFNEINIDWSKRLVLCEGVFDLMKCGENAVPMLGSDLNEQSKLFTQILVHNTPVALALDGDMWNSKTPKISKKLQEYNIDVLLVDVREIGDPGKMTKQQFKIALDNAITPTWSSNFFQKLDRVTETKFQIRSENNRFHQSYK